MMLWPAAKAGCSSEVSVCDIQPINITVAVCLRKWEIQSLNYKDPSTIVLIVVILGDC